MSETICLLNDSFPPVIDGVANAVVNYAAQIQAHHGSAVVMTPAYPGADDSGFPFPVVRYPSVDTRRLVGYVAGTPFSMDVIRYLQEHPVSLLHSHCPVASTLLARSVRNVVKAPVVFTYHTKFDIDIANAVRSKVLQEGAIRALVQNISVCDEVWVVSRGAGENLRSLGFSGNYTVMPNGVDIPRGQVDEATIQRTVASYDLPAGVPVFLFVGRLMWYKGIRIIIDALAQLRQQGVALRMVFVGGGGDCDAIIDYVKEVNLSDICFFTGPVYDRDAIRAWYCRADLFLFPSTFDTNGLVVREAAACGLASMLVLGSCAAEDVTDRRNGFLIEEDPASMAAQLTSLIAQPHVMQEVGQRAMEELYLSWEDAVAHACDRYRLVIEKYRSGDYPVHERPADEFFTRAGELLEALGRMEQRENQLLQSAVEYLMSGRQQLSRYMLQNRQEAQRRLKDSRQEWEDRILRAYDAFMEHMDRYL